MELYFPISIVSGFAIVIFIIGLGLYRRGRYAGAQDAYSRIVHGMGHHYDTSDGKVHDKVASAIDHASKTTHFEDFYNQLWAVGDALGYACWENGRDFGERTGLPREGEIQVEMTSDELSALRFAAHVGFQHLMDPREPLCIENREDAEDYQRVIQKLERKIRDDKLGNERHALSFNRQTMIWRRWPDQFGC